MGIFLHDTLLGKLHQLIWQDVLAYVAAVEIGRLYRDAKTVGYRS